MKTTHSLHVYAFLLCVLSTIAAAHQSIADPVTTTYIRDCRVGNGRNCPGPCPRRLFRKLVTPDNPPVTVRRGGLLRVKTFKNNHVGGFVRWSIVRVKDMYDHNKHRRNAFFYSCADQDVSKCTRKNREDFCPGDRKSEYYEHKLRVPKIYDDDVYVLGFAWYGGLTAENYVGFFGDYYDCTYVRIKGGPIRGSHRVLFHAGRSLAGKRGLCKATVNKLGTCRREPCKGKGPSGFRVGEYMKPAEFLGKRSPNPLRRVKSRGRK